MHLKASAATPASPTWPSTSRLARAASRAAALLKTRLIEEDPNRCSC
jgi:hypothetical protein